MITPILKFTDIKKDPNTLIGFSHAYICKRSDVVAHVVSNERMEELLRAEQNFIKAKSKLEVIYENVDLCKIHLKTAANNTSESFTAHGITDALDSLYGIGEED